MWLDEKSSHWFKLEHWLASVEFKLLMSKLTGLSQLNTLRNYPTSRPHNVMIEEWHVRREGFRRALYVQLSVFSLNSNCFTKDRGLFSLQDFLTVRKAFSNSWWNGKPEGGLEYIICCLKVWCCWIVPPQFRSDAKYVSICALLFSCVFL